MNEKYIKLKRTPETLEIFKKPKAFTLLSLIAYRARRTSNFSSDNLEIGEALIGDHKSAGLTRQEYRSALFWLKTRQFITTRATNKGTIAKLINTDVFDPNFEKGNHQTNQPITIQQPSSNHPVTTNKNDKNERNINTSPADADLLKKIETACESLYQSGQFPKAHFFKNKLLKQKVNLNALLHTLSQIQKYKIQGDDCWPYGMKIIGVENGNFNEAEYLERLKERERQAREFEKYCEQNLSGKEQI
jgi:hypothetical protein